MITKNTPMKQQAFRITVSEVVSNKRIVSGESTVTVRNASLGAIFQISLTLLISPETICDDA